MSRISACGQPGEPPRHILHLVGRFARIDSQFARGSRIFSPYRFWLRKKHFCESTFQKMDSSEDRTRITRISMRIGEKTRFARIWPSASNFWFFCFIDKRWCANRLPTKILHVGQTSVPSRCKSRRAEPGLLVQRFCSCLIFSQVVALNAANLNEAGTKMVSCTEALLFFLGSSCPGAWAVHSFNLCSA